LHIKDGKHIFRITRNRAENRDEARLAFFFCALSFCFASAAEASAACAASSSGGVPGRFVGGSELTDCDVANAQSSAGQCERWGGAKGREKNLGAL
jgi:hypothetical protein